MNAIVFLSIRSKRTKRCDSAVCKGKERLIETFAHLFILVICAKGFVFCMSMFVVGLREILVKLSRYYV